MAKLKRISPRKEPVQKRSIELRNAILQAATYILNRDGPLGFTTNKVAERAGVNIASLYQYYPNKESLLFHLVEIEWTTTFNSVFPILEDKSKTCRERLRLFIEKFYETEADEAPLRQAAGASGLMIENTREYLELSEKSDQVFMRFMAEALRHPPKAELKRKADFILQTVCSFSDKMPAREWTDVRGDARMMSDMLCDYFKIEG
jgi:AcrR family transcriptional regulator